MSESVSVTSSDAGKSRQYSRFRYRPAGLVVDIDGCDGERLLYPRKGPLGPPEWLTGLGREETPMGETLTPSYYATFTRGSRSRLKAEYLVKFQAHSIVHELPPA